MTAAILYENHAESATLAATSEAAGYDVENLADGLLYDAWRATSTATQNIDLTFGGSVTVDMFAIAGHNLGTVGATVQLQYGGSYTNLGASISPTDDGVIVGLVSSQASTSFRLAITGASAAPQIAVFALGERYTLPTGFRPGFDRPGLWDPVDVDNAESAGGLLLGRSVTPKPLSFRLSQDVLDDTDVAAWAAFVERAKRYPFFLAWDTSKTDEAVIAWAERIDESPRYQDALYTTAGMTCSALRTPVLI